MTLSRLLWSEIKLMGADYVCTIDNLNTKEGYTNYYIIRD